MHIFFPPSPPFFFELSIYSVYYKLLFVLFDTCTFQANVSCGSFSLISFLSLHIHLIPPPPPAIQYCPVVLSASFLICLATSCKLNVSNSSYIGVPYPFPHRRKDHRSLLGMFMAVFLETASSTASKTGIRPSPL